MAEIKIFCLHCGHNIQCEESCRGIQITCPSCGQSFQVPQAKKLNAAFPSPMPPPPPVAANPKPLQSQKSDDTQLEMTCRHCQGIVKFSEEMERASISCPHCGKELLLWRRSPVKDSSQTGNTTKGSGNFPTEQTTNPTKSRRKAGVDFFGKIDSRDIALNIINWVAAIYLAGIILNFFTSQVDAGLFIGLGIQLGLIFSLWKFKSRAAAIILAVLLAAGTCYLAATLAESDMRIFGLILDGLQLLATVRAIEATFKLNGVFSARPKA